jgi:hypothetical protein
MQCRESRQGWVRLPLLWPRLQNTNGGRIRKVQMQVCLVLQGSLQAMQTTPPLPHLQVIWPLPHPEDQILVTLASPCDRICQLRNTNILKFGFDQQSTHGHIWILSTVIWLTRHKNNHFASIFLKKGDVM